MSHRRLRRGPQAALPILAACFLAACEEGPPRPLFAECTAPEGTTPLEFEAAGNRLAGFIDYPAGAGPHPVVLFVGDREPTDVTQGEGDFARLRSALREAGVASVVWDRAGTGCSEGEFGGIADLYSRADEVVAALDALEARDDADTTRVGAWAVGEGGWVASMAAARSDRLAFLVMVGAPARTPVHQRLHLARANLALESHSQAEIDALVGRYERALNLLTGLADYQEFRQVAEPLVREPFFMRLDQLGFEVYPRRARYRELQSSAALEVSADVFLHAVEVPVLALFGDQDTQVDWRESVRVYRESFDGREGAELTVRVFEGAGHNLCPPGNGRLEARLAGDLCAYVEGYPDVVIEWLRSRGFTGT